MLASAIGFSATGLPGADILAAPGTQTGAIADNGAIQAICKFHNGVVGH